MVPVLISVFAARGAYGLCPSTHDLGIAHAKLAVVLHVCFFFRGALRPQKP